MVKFQNLVSSSILLSVSPSLSSSDSLMSSNLFGFRASTLSLATSSSPFRKSSSALSLLAPLPAALVVHLEIFPLRVECSHQVAKVAVHIVVGPFYKVLKNCVLQACDVFHVKMIQIWTFPAAPSTKRVLSLAE